MKRMNLSSDGESAKGNFRVVGSNPTVHSLYYFFFEDKDNPTKLLFNYEIQRLFKGGTR